MLRAIDTPRTNMILTPSIYYSKQTLKCQNQYRAIVMTSHPFFKVKSEIPNPANVVLKKMSLKYNPYS